MSPDGPRQLTDASGRCPGAWVLPHRIGPLDGRFVVPTSKSLTNRALIAAAVAGGGTVHDPLDCEDARLLADALQQAGWPVTWTVGRVEIGARAPSDDRRELFLGNSGTGVRLLMGLLAAVPGRFTLDGTARLRERPMAPLVEALRSLGAELRCADTGLPIEIDGRRLDGGAVRITPRVSSQFVSSLLLAGPLMNRGLELVVDGTLPSAPYVDLTRWMLEHHGAAVSVSADRRRWTVTPGGLRRTEYTVEGDWSAAAFGLAAAAVAGGRVEVAPLAPESWQGDRRICDILASGGTRIEWGPDAVVASGRRTRPLDADLSDGPDMFPALASVVAVGVPGSRLSGLEHLRHKESDRLAVMVENLSRLGARFRGTGSTLEVVETLRSEPDAPRPTSAAGDHRIAMAMAVAALSAGPLRLDDPSAVTKSFPEFWTRWEQLVSDRSGAGES